MRITFYAVLMSLCALLSFTSLAQASGLNASIAWSASTDPVGGTGVSGYTIQWCTGAACTPATTLTTTANTFYVQSGLTAATTYGYRVSAFDVAGNASAYSSTVYYTTPSTFRTILNADDFTRADNADIGTAWDAGYTGTNPFKIVSGRIQSTDTIKDSVESYNVSNPNDQWAQTTFSIYLPTNTHPGIMLHLANSPTFSGYECRVVAPGTFTRITRWNAGVQDLTVASTSGVTWGNGDKMRCEIQGTTMTIYRIVGTSETLVVSGSDGLFTTGKTGLINFSGTATSDLQLDKFVMGGFSGTPPVEPTVATVVADTTGATLTYGATTPTSIRVEVCTGSSCVNTVAPIASFPSGRYTTTWAAGSTYVCFHPLNAADEENTATSAYVCVSLVGLTSGTVDVGPSTGVLRILGTNTRWLTNDSGKALFLTGPTGQFYSYPNATASAIQDERNDATILVNDTATALNTVVAEGNNFVRFWRTEASAFGSAAQFAGNTYRRVPTTQMPWVQVNTRVDNSTGVPVTVGIYDLQQFNQPYFDRLRAAVLLAVNRGITPSVMLFEGFTSYANTQYSGFSHPMFATNNVNGISCDTVTVNAKCEETHSTANAAITAFQDAYIRKVIDTLNNIDGYLYEIANEDGVDTQTWQNHVADVVVAYEGSGGRKVHPVWMTPWGDVSFPPNNNFMYNNTHVQLVAPFNVGGDDFNQNPTANNASKTRNVWVYDTDHDSVATVATPWKNFTRGVSFGYLDCAFAICAREADVTRPLIRAAMGQARSYADRVNLKGMTVETGTSIINSGYGLYEACSEYLMYMPADGSNSIDLSACSAGLTFSVEFFEPLTGTTTASSNVAGGASRSFNPSGSNPMVVYLKLTPVVDTTPPTVFGGLPTGVQVYTTTSVVLQVSTNENATCRQSQTPGVSYAAMTNVFSSTGGTTHTQTVTTGQTPGTSHNRYVRCSDTAGNASTSDLTVSWSIASAPDVTPPVMSNPGPIQTLPAGTTSTTFFFTVDEVAVCRWATTNISYAAMVNAMTVTNLLASATGTGLSNGTTTNFYGQCSDFAAGDTGNVTTQAIVVPVTVAAAAGDVTLPSTVTNLDATAISSTQVFLQWTAATDNVAVAGYNIYMCSGAGCATYLLIAQIGNTTQTILSLSPSTSYSFVVRALDTSSNLSVADSNVATAITLPPTDVTPPSSMTGLTVTGAYTRSVLLAWNIGSDNASIPAAIIEQCLESSPPTPCSNFAVVKSQLTTGFLLQTVVAGSTYCWRGLWSDAAGNVSTSYSSTVCGAATTSGLDIPRTSDIITDTAASTRPAAGTRAPRQ